MRLCGRLEAQHGSLQGSCIPHKTTASIGYWEDSRTDGRHLILVDLHDSNDLPLTGEIRLMMMLPIEIVRIRI
jgi:hypothetical protein